MQQQYNHKKTEEIEENLIQQFVSKYLPFWPLFLTAIIIALVVAYTYSDTLFQYMRPRQLLL